MISIIIPAHNEEKYIAETLKYIQDLSYPKESFEVLVVENGSDDNTYNLAKKFEDENIKVFTVPTRGVSKAKNFGIKNISEKSEWIIFLDADTILKQNFLKDLNDYLQKNKDKNFTIGTSALRPLEKQGWYPTAWIKFYNIGHKYTKTSFAIQIMKASLRDKIKFNENLILAEDLELIKNCLKYGKFFYFDTDSVFTSIRRFEKVGWIRLFLKWNFDALVWRLKKTKSDHNHNYPVIR